MRSYTPKELETARLVGFTKRAKLRDTLLDPKSNVVIQTTLVQPMSDQEKDLDQTRWRTVTAVRGAGRLSGNISTPTKGIPNEIGYSLARSTNLLEKEWKGKAISKALQGPPEDFYSATSVAIADDVSALDIWHYGPDNSDLLANEVTHLIAVKFGDQVSGQMTRNLASGKHSFRCKQITWVGGYSVDTKGGDMDATSVEPIIMIGVIVIMGSELNLSGSTATYSAFGTTTLFDYKRGMLMPPSASGKLLAPYFLQSPTQRGYLSMCTEVTLAVLNDIERYHQVLEEA